MTNTEKVLADFDKKFPSHGYNDNAENEFHSQNIKRFLIESINQAVAEERERVVGIIEESQWECPEHGLPKFEKTDCVECNSALEINVVLGAILSSLIDMNKPKWNEEENLQIIIKDNGTARATTWARYYYSDEKLPTATVQGVHFDTEQTKAVNALVETSVKQAEQEMMKKVGEIDNLVNPYPKEVFPELPSGFMVKLALFCKENDTSIDRLSADYARWQRELTKDDLKSVITSLQDTNPK